MHTLERTPFTFTNSCLSLYSVTLSSIDPTSKLSILKTSVYYVSGVMHKVNIQDIPCFSLLAPFYLSSSDPLLQLDLSSG